MKNFVFLLSVLCAMILTGCLGKGETRGKLNGTEENLPEHLKGLKVDCIGIGGGNYIYVGTLPNRETVSLSYPEGKTKEHVIIVLPDNNCNERTITAKEIIMENDSMILIKK